MKNKTFIVDRLYSLNNTPNYMCRYTGNDLGINSNLVTVVMSDLDLWTLVSQSVEEEELRPVDFSKELINKDATVGIRTFNTGANRNSDEGKLDFEGFLSPTVLKKYAEYMHDMRHLENGEFRDSDNWQKGIPIDVYMKSMYRHFFDVWSNHRGIETKEDKITNLCALLFNVMGMLHETLKEE